MKPKITIENWNGYEIRFVWTEDKQEWWAVAADVAKSLGYNHTPHMTRNIDDDEKGVRKADTLGGEQEMAIISESGIYEAIWGSHKPEAKTFKKWVKQVIKTLRQSTGLEGFQIFRMLDKERQKEMMAKLKSDMKEPDKGTFIKANVISNKAVANIYGLPKTVNKSNMTPEQLQIREEILADTVEVMTLKDKYDLNMSVSKTIYDKYAKLFNVNLAG